MKEENKEYYKNKEYCKIIEDMIGHYYNIETICNKDCLYSLLPSKHGIVNSFVRTYRHLKLVNVNGMGTGQAHFINDEGQYILLPWCYIISMIPVEVKQK